MIEPSWKLVLESIAGRAYLVPSQTDEQEALRLEYVAQELGWVREKLGTGISDRELALRHEYRIRFMLIHKGIDPDGFEAETHLSVGARLLPLVLAVVRPMAE